MSSLSQDQITQFKEAFSLFDQDGDGMIANAEIGTVIRSLGQNISQRELKDLIKEADSNHKGAIEFPEFLTMMARKLKDGDNAVDIKAAFRMFDPKGTGYISANELRHVLTSMGEKLSKDEVDEMIRDTNADAQGRIQMDDFMRVMLAGAATATATAVPTSPTTAPAAAAAATPPPAARRLLMDVINTMAGPRAKASPATASAAAQPGDFRAAFPLASIYQPRAHIVHVKTSRNNTIATLTDYQGNAIVWASAGTVGMKKSHRGSSDIGYQAVLQLNEKAVKKGLDLLVDAEAGVELRLNGYGAAREMAFRAVRAMGWNIRRVSDVTPIRHAGCRPKRKRRL
ncbi:hypothetical protein HDU98_005075 [Podochytrium sp. JEL0797]|nr:hypothetical protein HDU98_005075 [Podochytrium sp. JEL0797]